MGLTLITLLRLIMAAILPVILAAGFYFAEKNGLLNKWSYIKKQIIIGICFGVVAILATEFGIPFDGAVVNVRNAAPLTAGLIFGGPSGIIAGLIGGIERWFSNAGDYTRTACTIATVAAGFLGAYVRKFMMDNKKASWFFGLAVGVTAEVLHMLLIVLTNADDIQRAFRVVFICTMPMVIANGVSVMFSIISVSIIKNRIEKSDSSKKKKENITQTFQRWLLICVVLAFTATTVFSDMFFTQIAYADAKYTLKNSLEDVKNDIMDVSDRNLLEITRKVASRIYPGIEISELRTLAGVYDVREINIVDSNGIIIASTDRSLLGFDMRSGEQSSEFLVLLDGEKEFVQEYQPVSRNANVYRKYAGIALENEFVQVGYDSNMFHGSIREQVKYAAQNRRIGQEGWILICDEDGIIVSDREGHAGEKLADIIGETGFEERPETIFSATIHDEPAVLMYTETEGYYIIAVMSEEEVLFSKTASIYMLAFMETLVFAALFTLIFFLIKRLIIVNIRKINSSLAKITAGNLDVTVDVRDNEEFASLSDDINSTVSTLKHYIDEAAARFDEDLEIAKKIQHSSLPSVFPPYPNRKDFSIFASMDAAKEVGGDFYDFYLLDENRLAFVVADVSGKGIPGAMFMMTAKTLIKGFAESGLKVNEVFTKVNNKLCENNEAGMFVTGWMGILDTRTGLISYANAGHNPPAIKHCDGSYEYLRSRPNLVLAGMENINYREQQVQLQPGDEIYLYTDGVTEAHDMNKQLFGEKRLIESLNRTAGMSVEKICAAVRKDVNEFVGEAEQFDDITMLCIRINGINSKSSSFAPTIESVKEAAEFAEKALEDFEVPKKLIVKLMVAIDEIYSNIVRYSGADKADILIEKNESELKVVFADNGKPYNPLEREDPDVTASAEERSIGGLGIYMVRKMMDSVDYEYRSGMNRLTIINNLEKYQNTSEKGAE